MYQSKLLDCYKKAKNYVQDKQIAHDLNLPSQRISEMRKGKRYISDEEAVFLAEQAGIDPELALLGCHADRNENPRIKQLWEHIAKKQNRLGLKAITMGYAVFSVVNISDFQHSIKCALSALMFNIAYQRLRNETFIFESFINEILRNDKKLCFS